MLFKSLRQGAAAVFRQASQGAKNHYRLSQMWFRSLLATKTATLVFCCFILSGFPEVYNEQALILIGFILCVFVSALPVRWSLKAALIVCVLSAVRAVGFGNELTAPIEMGISISGLRSLLVLLCITIAAMMLSSMRSTALGFLCLINSALTILSFYSVGNLRGLSIVSTVNSAFTAMLLPFCPPVFLVLPLFAIYLAQGALAYAIVGIHFFIFVAYGHRIFLAPLCAVLTFIVFNWAQVPSEGRMEMYRHALDFYNGSGHFWLGMGLGSFETLGLVIQKIHNFSRHEYWVSLHSDWLQHLVETGALGLFTAMVAFVDALWVNRKDVTTVSTIAGLGAFAVFYYPFRVPVIALVCGVIVFQALRKR